MAVKDLARTTLRRVPAVRHRLDRRGFGSSDTYWDRRYANGGNSGEGSYGRLAEFKAEYINQLVADNDVHTVLDLGCGDGNQLTLGRYEHYIGLDVSPTVILQCQERFAGDYTKSFAVHDARTDPPPIEVCDLSMSLDVVYHLVEDPIFDSYMRHLFAAPRKLVVVYASDRNEPQRVPHVRHRRFTDWVTANEPGWQLAAHVPNRYPESLKDGGETSFADFFVFVRAGHTIA